MVLAAAADAISGPYPQRSPVEILHLAILEDAISTEVVRDILKGMAGWLAALPDELDVAMYLACVKGRAEIIHHLVNAGANPAADMGHTRLLVRMRMAAMLQHQGQGQQARAIVTEYDATPLHIAVYHGHAAVVQALLTYPSTRASIRRTAGHPGRTPLQIAVRTGHHDLISPLMDAANMWYDAEDVNPLDDRTLEALLQSLPLPAADTGAAANSNQAACRYNPLEGSQSGSLAARQGRLISTAAGNSSGYATLATLAFVGAIGLWAVMRYRSKADR